MWQGQEEIESYPSKKWGEKKLTKIWFLLEESYFYLICPWLHVLLQEEEEKYIKS